MTGEFSALLRRLRTEAGLTQEALAERAGVGVRTVRGLETGERADPRVTTVRLLAAALELQQEEQERLLSAAVGRASDGDPEAEADGPAVGPREADPEAEGGDPEEAGPEAEGGDPEEADPEAEGGPPPSGEQPVPRPAAYTPYLLHSEPTPQDELARAAEELAHAVAARWQREEEQRQIQDPFPLPVRWRPAAEELTDHWANICRAPAGGTAEPLALSGRLDEIVDVYRRVPSGRLAVLGRSGSGKSVLAVRFVLDLLKSRDRAGPVPVIFSVGSWNPAAVPLRDWLADQLTRDHPGLAGTGPGRTSTAAALVEAGRILPVLDGFDEIADGLRGPALDALNATALPLLLTSRPVEYTGAVTATDVLTSAAAVELTDLTLDDLADYLPRTARKTGGADAAATVWDPVLAELRERPHGTGAANLTAVLTTPLMVTLVRAVYSDTPGRDPGELLDSQRFAGPEELADHLLGDFVPTVYGRRAEHRLPVPGRRFDPDRAQRWLGYLARHLTRLGTPDLAWWQLGAALHPSTRTQVTGLVTGLAVGAVDCCVGGLFSNFAFQFVDGTVVGLLAGLMFGLGHWLTVSAKSRALSPSYARVQLRNRAGRPRRTSASRFAVGLLCGFMFGAGYGAVVGLAKGTFWGTDLPGGPAAVLCDGLLYGLVFGLGAGFSFSFLELLETPVDTSTAVSPPDLLHTNRTTVLAQFLVWTLAFGLVAVSAATVLIWPLHGLGLGVVWAPAAALKFGTLSGLGAALGYTLTQTAWGQWVVFSRIWLPLTGRLPWNVVAFLDDAYRRGVLRQAGAVYQFRHARLQHHLSRAYRERRGTSPPRA